MKYRKLRIAWSVGCGMLCLLLIALWVRSYWWADSVTYIHSVKTMFCAYSARGRCWNQITPQSWGALGSSLDSHYIASQPSVSLPNSLLGFYFRHAPSEDSVFWAFPYWFPALLAGVIAALPWLRYRFSLRTLLIGMTVVAVVLGLIIYAAR